MSMKALLSVERFLPMLLPGVLSSSMSWIPVRKAERPSPSPALSIR